MPVGVDHRTMTSIELGRLEMERARYEHLLDDLTGLPKWALLIDRTAVALARAQRTGNQVAVFVIDDPHFAHGPRTVKTVVATLQERIRPDDTLARLDDRRFAVMCNEMPADQDAALVARRLVYSTGIVCGLGVALSDADDNPEQLIGRALVEAARVDPNRETPRGSGPR
jgi:GGDEF domain-containing protein